MADNHRGHRRAPKDDGHTIFRRYRTLPNGRVLDARDYGLEAWPIRIRSKKRKR